MAEIIRKHIRCLPCAELIAVRQFRVEREAVNDAEKGLQDRRIADKIGVYTCPKCRQKAAITEPPLLLFDADMNKLGIKYRDEVDMSKVEFNRYGHAIWTDAGPLS